MPRSRPWLLAVREPGKNRCRVAAWAIPGHAERLMRQLLNFLQMRLAVHWPADGARHFCKGRPVAVPLNKPSFALRTSWRACDTRRGRRSRTRRGTRRRRAQGDEGYHWTTHSTPTDM